MTHSHTRPPLTRRRALQLGAAASATAMIGFPALAQAPAEVKVALLAPTSGALARQGELMRAGAQLAIDEINAAGGVKALNGARMALIVFDAGDSAEKAKNAAQRMVAEVPDLVGGTGAWFSSYTIAVTEVTERAELPWLTLSYSPAITDRGFKYIFQTSPTASDQSERALPTIMKMAEAATGKQPRSLAILTDNSVSGEAFFKPIREGAKDKYRIDILSDETYSPPLSDATTLVQHIRSARPEFAFVVPSSIADSKLILDKFAEYGLGGTKLPKVANGGSFGQPEILKTIGPENLEGLMVINANWGGKHAEDVVKRFKEITGEPWMTQDSMCTYADMWVFKEAMEAAGSADRRKVAEAIRAFDLNTGPALLYPGGHLKFDEKGRRVDTELVIIQWQNGEPVPVYPPALAVAPARWG